MTNPLKLNISALLSGMGVYLRLLLSLLPSDALRAEVVVSNLFGDNMVLQRERPIHIWGSATEGEKVVVKFAGQTVSTKTGPQGRWFVSLDPLPAGGPYTLEVIGRNRLQLNNILLGEVWVASGQSNMEWPVRDSHNGDLTRLTAGRNDQIRFLAIRNPGGQSPASKIEGRWAVAGKDSVSEFSAVAYAFAETLHAALGVPIGIIENAWGGSTAEAWLPRETLMDHPDLEQIHRSWTQIEAEYDFARELAQWQTAVKAWEAQVEIAGREGSVPPGKPEKPSNRLFGQHRPGNLWNSRVMPIIPVSMRGVIWYQGESNENRWMQYRTLFPTLIQEWRKAWGWEFPFYWVQLAGFRLQSAFDPESLWAPLREAQTLTLNSLPKTGQAVAIDLGEPTNIHPRAKEEVGRRLARWALNRDYGYDELACRSPEFESFSQDGSKLFVKFTFVGEGLQTIINNYVKGFFIRTNEGEWTGIKGKIVSRDTVLLELPSAKPVSEVRYAWADHPVCNLYSMENLPVTPFRTDVPANPSGRK